MIGPVRHTVHSKCLRNYEFKILINLAFDLMRTNVFLVIFGVNEMTEKGIYLDNLLCIGKLKNKLQNFIVPS